MQKTPVWAVSQSHPKFYGLFGNCLPVSSPSFLLHVQKLSLNFCKVRKTERRVLFRFFLVGLFVSSFEVVIKMDMFYGSGHEIAVKTNCEHNNDRNLCKGAKRITRTKRSGRRPEDTLTKSSFHTRLCDLSKYFFLFYFVVCQCLSVGR